MSTQQSGLPCIKCTSSDALTVYPKGDGFCFSCETYFSPAEIEAGDIEVKEEKKKGTPNPLPTQGKAQNVPSRGLHKQTLEYYGVTCAVEGERGEVASLYFPVYSGGTKTGTKIKDLATKSFGAQGSTKDPDFFGQDRAGNGGKLLIVTEGEEDCMSAYQLLQSAGKNYKVVSLPNGANMSAVKRHLKWLERFETIILNLDNDDKGREASKQIAQLLTPGKVKIMGLPSNVKDTNEFLIKGGQPDEWLRRLNGAKEYSPAGIVSLRNLEEILKRSDDRGPSLPYPWSGLNRLVYGMREREITTWTAGTGVGKSAIMRELEHYLLKMTRDSIGIIALEESNDRTIWGILGVEAGLPLGTDDERIKLGLKADHPDVKKYIENIPGFRERVYLYDSFGVTADTNVMADLRYMIKAFGAKYVVLDHLGMLTSGGDPREDERKTIDRIMTQLRQLTEETGASLQLVSHLRRLEGNRGHENGAEVNLSHLRGSQAIAQLSDIVIAIERDQQADNELEANLNRLRVLKNRYSGLTGIATHLAYDRETGKLTEIHNVDEYLAPSTEEAGC